jgi:hypothetical protein
VHDCLNIVRTQGQTDAQAAQIGVVLARLELNGSKGKTHIILVGGLRNHDLIDTDLGEMSHHTIVSLSVCRLGQIGDDLGSFTTQNTAINLCSSHHCCGQKIAVIGSLQLDDRLSPVPFSGSVRLTYGRPSSPETRSLKYFPRPLCGLLADQNTWMNGSSTALRPFRFRLRAAAISGHASPGNGFRTRHQMETSHDCYRLRQQAR